MGQGSALARVQSGHAPRNRPVFTGLADGTAVAPTKGMVDVRQFDTCARIDSPMDARLGKYQSLAVALLPGLILALMSVPDVSIPLR